MALKICTSEFLLSTPQGLGLKRSWFPRIVAEAYLESTRDGEIKLSPDPVTMIDGDLTWINNTTSSQRVAVMIHKGPRNIVAQSPNTVVLHDAHSWQVGESPMAEFPSVGQNIFGGRMQIDRSSVAANALQFGRLFMSGDDHQQWVDIGEVKPLHTLHFRYLCAVQTPGTWTLPTEFDHRVEAAAYWCRLQAWAGPYFPAAESGASFTFVNPGLTIWPLPPWIEVGDLIDMVGVGAGSGSVVSTIGLANGGLAGSWNHFTAEYGTDIPESDNPAIYIHVGAGGSGGNLIYPLNSGPGGSTVFNWVDNPGTAIVCQGGAGAVGGVGGTGIGASPGNHSYLGMSFTGGAAAGVGGAGNGPGGGAGATFPFTTAKFAFQGLPGAPGAAWVRPRKAS